MIVQFILLLIFNFSFASIQQLNNQNFIIKRFSKYFNLKNIYINENNDQKLLEILIEFNSIILNKYKQIYITPENEFCEKNDNTKIYSLEGRPIIDDEIIKFQFIQDLNNNYRRGILICISRPEKNLPSYGIVCFFL